MKQINSILEQVSNYQNLVSLLQKNSNLSDYGGFNKSLLKLSENQAEMTRYSLLLKKDNGQISENLEHLKINLSLQYQHLSGILNMIENKGTKGKLLNVSYKKVEKLKGKELIKQAQKAVSLANKLGGFSVNSLNDVSRNALNEKFDQAKKLAEKFGLTAEKVKKLEETSMTFIKADVEVKNAKKEQVKAIKEITKKLDHNARIYKNKIDKFVQIYEKPESNFMKAYKGFRQEKEEIKIDKKMQVA